MIVSKFLTKKIHLAHLDNLKSQIQTLILLDYNGLSQIIMVEIQLQDI
jgi:hypothetical protein